MDGFPAERRILPMEMLERIFMFLPPKDLKTVMRVCKRWKEVGSAPKLWSWIVLKLNTSSHGEYAYQWFREDVELCLQKISLPRLQAVREIQLYKDRKVHWEKDEDSGVKLIEPLLCKALSHPGLKKLVIHGWDIRKIEPELLASFLTKMEEMDISDITMSAEQSGVFFSAIKKVEKLTLKLDLSLCSVQELFKALHEEDASVKSLSIDNCPRVNQIGPVLMSEVVAKLEQANLGGWNLTKAQWTAICNAIRAGSKLKKLLVPRNNLGEVESSVFFGIQQHLVELDLGSTSLRAAQSETIMLSVATSPGKLKKLMLEGNDLENVDVAALAGVATMIESLNIAKTEISRKQAEEIFKAIARSPGVLKNLNMDSNDLREVDPKVMADAVNKLEKVCFSDMPLLEQRQMRTILTQALEQGTTLKELSISPERRTMSVFHENQNQSMYNQLFPAVKLFPAKE